MRCNPFRWLLGLLPVLLLAGVAVLSERDRIEKDLTARAQQALESAGFAWASTSFEGRDALLSGLAFDETEPAGASKLLTDTYGVRIVRSDAKLIDKAERYDWVASRRDGRIRLGGLVPNEKTRREIIGIARATFPSHEIIDRLTLARGAPALDTWLGGVGFGLKQLALLKSGSVHLEMTELTIAGEANDAGAYRAVKTALATGLPPGISLKADRVEAPVVAPYVWTARLAADQLELRGSVPGEKVREDLLTAARRAMPRARPVDAMLPARGEPDGWETVVRGLLRELGRLEEGSAEVRDHAVTVIGVALKEATADDVREKLKEAVPSGYRLVDRITFREPTIKAVSPYVTTLTVGKDAVVLTGYVPNAAARSALASLVQTRFAGRRVVDQLELGTGQIPAWQRCLDVGLTALSRLGNGVLALSDRRLALSADTEDESLARVLPAELRAAANRDCDPTTSINLKVKPEPMLRWSATAGETGDVVLEGEVPGAEVRNEIVALATRLYAPRNVIDRMILVGDPSERWQRTALFAITQLARLRLGRATIVGQEMTLEGQARDVVAHEAIRDAIGRALPDGYQGREALVVRSDAMIAAEQAGLRKAEEEARQRAEAEAEAKRRADEAARQRAEEDARRAEEDARRRISEGIRQHAEAEAKRRAAADEELSRRNAGVRPNGEAQRRAQEEERRRAAEAQQRRIDQLGNAGSEEERRQRLAEEARRLAEVEAKRRAAEEEERTRQSLAARQRSEAEAQQRADAEANEQRRRVEEAARQAREAEARRLAQEEQQRKQVVVDACTTALESVTTQGEIRFDWASARLDRRSYPTLRKLAEAARTCPGVTIDIEGHTDAEGTDERNQPLSERRAEAVVDFLIDAGVPAERMKAVGYGSTRPIAPNDTAAGRARNRRIAFTVKAN